jgi:hypothetical protein
MRMKGWLGERAEKQARDRSRGPKAAALLIFGEGSTRSEGKAGGVTPCRNEK